MFTSSLKRSVMAIILFHSISFSSETRTVFSVAMFSVFASCIFSINRLRLNELKNQQVRCQDFHIDFFFVLSDFKATNVGNTALLVKLVRFSLCS